MLLQVDKDELELLRGALDILNTGAVENKKKIVGEGEIPAVEYGAILNKSIALEGRISKEIDRAV
jgi:hypothetical protein